LNIGKLLRVIIDENPNSCEYNMAVDEAIMKLFNEVQFPTLRFYKWKNPSLSIGKFQRISEIDVEFLKKTKIDLVRRPTGGKAVLHDDELTYSIVIPLEYFEERSVIGSYRKIATALAFGLKKLGIECDLHRKKSDSGEKFKAACFSVPSMYEITVSGKKLIGSAQIRNEKIVLQHGSIPFSLDIDVYSNCFKMNEKAKEQLKRILRASTVAIKQLNSEIDEKKLIDCLIKGIEEIFEFKHFVGECSKRELDLVESLKEKYKSKEWTFRA